MRCLVVSRIVGNRWTQPPPTITSRNHCKIQDLLVKVSVQMFDQQWEETAIFGNATSAFVSQLKWAEKKAKRRWCHQSTRAMWSEPSGLYHGCDVEWLEKKTWKKMTSDSKISPCTHWTKHDMMLEDWEPLVEPHKNHHLWLNVFPGCKPLAIHGARRGCQKTAAWITSFGQLQVMSRRDILSHLVAGAWGVFFMYLASACGSTIYVANSSMWFQTKCRMYLLEWEKQEGSENHETSAWRDGLQDLLNGVIATKTSCHLESLQRSTNRHHTAATTWVPTT